MQRTLERKSALENDSHRGKARNVSDSVQSRRPLLTARLFGPARQFDPSEPELMDRPDVNKAWLREELETLERLNRLGGHRLIVRYIEKLTDSKGIEELSILDLATGAADIPRAIATWAKKKGTRVSLTAVDGNEHVLRSAREWCRDWPQIQLEHYDLLDLPYGRGSFDIVLCSLALHHFTTENAVMILGRMNEIARTGFILNDLQRNWLSIWTSELLARTIMRSPLVRHDGPQSFRAAFTATELRGMAREAGIKNFTVNRHQGIFRMVLAARK